MASDLSSYLGNALIRWIAGNAMPTAPSAVYAGLFDGNPKSGGTEVTTTIRAGGRVAVTFAAPSAGTDHDMVNSADVDFGNAAGDADVSHIGIFDASSSGNLIASKAVTGGPFSVLTGAAVKVLAGDLSFNIGSDT